MGNVMEMTSFSKKEWESITEDEMSPTEVVQYFYENLQIRSFSEILMKYLEIGGGKENLIERLCEYDSFAKKDSIRKNVSNWLNGKSEPGNREEQIKLCFALKLSEDQAQSFLRYLSGELHVRNPREIVFLFCLRTGRTYRDALNMIEKIGELGKEKNGSEEVLVQTKLVIDNFRRIRREEDFWTFYSDNNTLFGELHNTAYEHFLHFLKTLMNPTAAMYTELDESYSIEQVVNTYLRMNLPLDKQTAKYSLVQKMIRSYWPNTTIIKNMRNRMQDVNRKTLLLLYVVTEGIEEEVGEDEDFLYEQMTPAERLEEYAWKINMMLYDCGMGLLDPRNPFDWMILYSLKTNEDDWGMSDRLQAVLEALFLNTPERPIAV